MNQIKKIKNFFTKGHERSVLLKLNIISLFFLRGVSILVSFIVVPITINYLNPTEYGIWLTLSSILIWVDFFDIGIGHGLRNKLSEALAKKDYELGKSYVSTAFVFFILISAGFFLIMTSINQFLNWSVILNISPESGEYISGMVLWLCGLFCLRFVFKLLGIILLADQRPAFDTLLSVVSSILSVIIIFILTETTKGSLKLVSIAFSITYPFVFSIASIILFRGRYKLIAPSYASVNVKYIKDLLGLGVKFFIIQLSTLLIFSSSNFIIIQLYGAKEVTSYNIAYKYFNIIMVIFVIIVNPMWSAFTNAYAKGDIDWIRNSVKKIQKLWYLSILLTALLILISNFFYDFWIGKTVHIPFSISVSISIYAIVYNLHSTYIYVINGTGKIYIQTIHSIFALVFYLPLAYILTKYMGVSGVINASTIILLPLVFVTYIQYKKIVSKTANGIWNK
ncbi:oligosaccharide flippase family protein [Emticicia sp. CRIBPO]|uniref:lipopolysaccharide biosynthesis protein n=1 Tax=Emticicia sp. CRIBPO TaxID=2683258 RepID=UPI001412A842|nr:oligosaccharide flippase family protein [Emticicia sp. CRIBPO]NBA87091.1 oligosaccharide flippase family protein [Emticicia sp. CRIBPO]